MPKKISEETWLDYCRYRFEDNLGMREAATKAGIGFSSAYRLETDPLSNSTGRGPLERYRQTNIPGIKDNDHLKADAKKALADFAYFRLRYFGRRSKKWQIAAANQILALLETNKREFAVINAPPGCLSGDTVLTINRGGCSRQRTIADVHRMLRGGETANHMTWDLSVPMSVSRAEGGVGRLGRVEDVWESGVKQTYTLTTETGKSIRATAEHPFMRPGGTFTTLGDLRVNDEVMTRQGQGFGRQPKPRYHSTYTNFHPCQRKGKGGWRTPTHRLVMEAHLNGVGFLDYLYALRANPIRCKEFIFLTPDDVVHHLDENHLNNNLSNLALTTHAEHKQTHAPSNTPNVLYQMGAERIVSIEPYGLEMTYDLAVADDPHNFIANEFVVHNSGKSVLFTHDIPCWLIARKRSIRIMVISASESRARQYTEQILTTLERTSPPPLEDEQEARGAVRAQACMQADFGRFKPENARRWRAGSFKVAQAHDMVGTSKESTVVGVGADTRYLGDRVDLLIADDLVTEETTGTPEAREKVLRKWRNEAEKRIEKRGVCILQGQRMKAEDLYRTCIDLKAWADPNDIYSDPDARKYLHVIFKAHYEDRCDGQHLESDPEYDPFNPDSGGCLLDPVGLPWPYLMQERADDERTYRTVFQQEDMDPNSVLVNPLWVDGGEDPVTGEMFPGCWDIFRPTGVIPPVAGVSYLSVDSSPAQWWANEWWYYSRETDRRFLIDLHRARMKVTDALEYNKDTKQWSGLFEDWWHASVEQGAQIGVLVFEANAAEDFFLRSRDLIDWASRRSVRIIKHETHRNKTDPKMGVQTLGPLYRHGKVRLPGDKISGSYKKSMHLVTEVTRYPESNTIDCLMAQWFGEYQLHNIVPVHTGTIKRANHLYLATVPRSA